MKRKKQENFSIFFFFFSSAAGHFYPAEIKICQICSLVTKIEKKYRKKTWKKLFHFNIYFFLLFSFFHTYVGSWGITVKSLMIIFHRCAKKKKTWNQPYMAVKICHPLCFWRRAARVCEWMLRFDNRSCIPAINIIFVIFLPTGV